MKQIDIHSLDELNYTISATLLHDGIQNAIITTELDTLLADLAIYMMDIGIPTATFHIGDTQLRVGNSQILDADRITIGIYVDGASIEVAGQDTYDYLVYVSDPQQRTIEQLKTTAADFDLDSVPDHLKNEQIRDMFLRTFSLAQKEIDIISPWMNTRVVNPAFIGLMEEALQRGVKIRIQYGLNPGTDAYSWNRSHNSDLIADDLKEQFAPYGDAFRIERKNLHYKLVLCDNLYKLEGSYNYLSFDGDYSNPDQRGEGSPFGRDVAEIERLRKEYFGDD